jgi:hypothetical protein
VRGIAVRTVDGVKYVLQTHRFGHRMLSRTCENCGIKSKAELRSVAFSLCLFTL